MKPIFSGILFSKTLSRLRLWLWHHGGERLGGLVVFLYGHGCAWAAHNTAMREQKTAEKSHRAVAALCALVGFMLLWGGTATPHASMFEQVARVRFPTPVLGLTLCRWTGLLVLVGALTNFVGIMEWTQTSEKQRALGIRPAQDAAARNFLRLLLQMRLFGTVVGGCYWALSAALLCSANGVFNLPFLWTAALALWHSELAIEINEIYARDFVRSRPPQTRAGITQSSGITGGNPPITPAIFP